MLPYKHSVSLGSPGRCVWCTWSCGLTFLMPGGSGRAYFNSSIFITWQIMILSPSKTIILSLPPHYISEKCIFSSMGFTVTVRNEMCGLRYQSHLVAVKTCLKPASAEATLTWMTHRVLCFWIYDVIKMYFLFVWKKLVFAWKTSIINIV